VFVREGPFKDGIFKFQINIPTSYPAKAPEVTFITKVYHPFVDLKSGKLDLTVNI
jgi:ubiquitin-protein ligase